MLVYNKSNLPGMADNRAVFAPFVEKDGHLWHQSDIGVRTRDLDVWKGYNRIQPMTSLNIGLLSNQEIDFQIGSFMSNGFLDEMYAEITITEGNTSNAQFNPYDLVSHLDVLYGNKYFQMKISYLKFYTEMLMKHTDLMHLKKWI